MRRYLGATAYESMSPHLTCQAPLAPVAVRRRPRQRVTATASSRRPTGNRRGGRLRLRPECRAVGGLGSVGGTPVCISFTHTIYRRVHLATTRIRRTCWPISATMGRTC